MPELCRTVRSVAVVGGAIRGRVLRAISERIPDCQIATGYGLTELNGSISAALSQSQSFEESAGWVVPTVDIKIVDKDGGIVPEGAIGRILVERNMMMSGYIGADGQSYGLSSG